ncbi:hypothetical protein niasHS_006911 [Heterodera schachtii]|uniref:14-3-3 domain-containing protein n=2 Tax=Heterodera TaxID=34509 RepID=A0ABD2JG99_HETSC
MESNRELILYRAKLADQAVRYYDMAQLMKKVVEMDNVLNEEERNMLSIAYKAVIRPLRFALREISPIEWTQDGTEKQLQMLKRYRDKLVKELHDTSNELVELLDALIPRAHDSEVKVFYLKMKADVYRYMAAEAIGGVVDKSRQAYQEAYDIAKDKLRPANATRLGLGLNFCIFYYDNLDMEENAIDFAKKVLEDANSDERGGACNESEDLKKQLREHIERWEEKASNKKHKDDNEASSRSCVL